MSHLWSWPDLCNALGVPPVEGPGIDAIAIDSRTTRTGDLFVAISGKARPEFNIFESSGRDGHSFVVSAIEAGASGVMVHDGSNYPIPTLECEETLDGLWRIAQYRRNQIRCPVIGLTGSSGKTTLKGFLREAMNGYASEGSLNNHLGVPISMSNTPVDAGVAIYEIGTNHPGEIAMLSKLVRPDIAVLLNVHPAHIGNFIDMDALRREKLSISEGLGDTGTLVIPVELANHELIANSNRRTVTHGSEPDSDVRFSLLDNDNVEIQSATENIAIPIPGGGEHRAATLCAAAATLVAMNVPLRRINRIKGVLPKGRGNLEVISDMVIVDESYNANPASMKEAIKTLANSKAMRKIAIVGTMNELGEESARFHRDLVLHFVGIDRVICIGEYMREVFDTLPERQKWIYFDEPGSQLIDECLNELRAGDRVLIKASNSVFWKCDFVDNLTLALKNRA